MKMVNILVALGCVTLVGWTIKVVRWVDDVGRVERRHRKEKEAKEGS